jgi:hypothetical protein
MIGDAIRAQVLSALPAIEAIGPPGETAARHLRNLLAREDLITPEEWLAALSDLKQRLPDLGDDLRRSLNAISSLLVSTTHDQQKTEASASPLWALAGALGKGVAEWVVSPQSAALTRRVAAAMIPAAEKLAPYLRDLAEQQPATVKRRASESGAAGMGGGNVEPSADGIDDEASDDDIDFDPFEMGTLGSGGRRND